MQFLKPDIILRGMEAVGVNQLQADQSLRINQDLRFFQERDPPQTTEQFFRGMALQGDDVHFFEQIPCKGSRI
jgi:hypothetical protein